MAGTTDPWGFLFGAVQVDEGFAPDLGFVARDGYRQKQALLRRSFRLDRPVVRRVSFRTNNDWFDSLRHGALESRGNSLQCEIELENGDDASLQVSRDFERLFEPFELDEGLVFAPGGYTFTSASAEYHSDESRRWGFDGEATMGGFYDGDTRQLGAEAWFVFNRHLRTAGGYSTVSISSGHGDVDWRLWSLRLDYIHSSTLSASGYLQVNSSTGSKVLNLRLRWILPRDSNLYLVYNDSREDLLGPRVLRSRELALKVSYRFFL